MEETICHGVLLIFPSGKHYLPFFRGTLKNHKKTELYFVLFHKKSYFAAY
jgi:hypothetical protein